MKTMQVETLNNAALYVRVSTDEQAQLGYSIEAQKEKLSAFCKSQEWDIFDLYVDDGYRATSLNRPQIQRLIEEAAQQKFNLVVFYKLDRLSRSVKDLNFLIEHFAQNNIAIKSITEPFDTSSPPGKLMFNMLGSFAQFERELIGERTKLGLYRAFDEGKWTTTPPFGYNIKDGQLVLNEKEAFYVKRAIELFMVENSGIKTIAKQLKLEDKVTRRAGKWAKNSVWNLLHNPVYCGMALWKGEIRKREHRPIITKEEFDAIQERLHEKYLIPPHENSSPNFLLGLIECGKCGSKLKVSIGKQKYRYYACAGRDDGCDLKYIPAESLEDAVLNEIKKVASDKKVINDCLKDYKLNNLEDVKTLRKEAVFLKRQLQELSGKKERQLNWLSATLPDKNVTRRIALEIGQITEQMEKIKIRLIDIEKELERKEFGEVKIELIVSFLDRFLGFFKEWDFRQRKLFIRTVLTKVIVYSREKSKLIFSLPISKGSNLIDIPTPREGLTRSPAAETLPVTPLVLSGVGEGI